MKEIKEYIEELDNEINRLVNSLLFIQENSNEYIVIRIQIDTILAVKTDLYNILLKG